VAGDLVWTRVAKARQARVLAALRGEASRGEEGSGDADDSTDDAKRSRKRSRSETCKGEEGDSDKADEDGCAGATDERVRELSAEEAASGRFSLADVVLPLPGRGVRYPPHLEGAYADLLGREGATLADPGARMGEFARHLSGGYRALLARPELLEHEWEDSEEGGTEDVLLLRFRLPRGCYATVALREIMKTE
jgi:tRNA(Glu) U13 pseudouridine synthase TruD